MALYEVAAQFSAVDGISSVVDKIGSGLAGLAQNGKLSGEGLSEGFDMAAVEAGVFAGALGVVVAVGAAVLDFHEQEQLALARFSATTGQSGAAVDDFKKKTEALFASGLVNNFNEAANIVGEVEKRMKGVANFDAATFETNVAAVAKAWDTDGAKLVDKTIEISGKFDDLKNKPNEVLDMLVKMAQNSGRPIDDLAAKIDKFGTNLAYAGLTGTLAFDFINAAIMAGVSDDGLGKLSKALDTLHDKFINPPAGFQAALDKLGLPDLAKEVQQNKIPISTAYEQIFQKLGAIKDNAVQAEVFTTLFGKSAAGAITPDMIDKMSHFAGSLGDTKDAASKVAEVMKDDGTLGTALKQLYNTGLVNVNAGFDNIYHILKDTDWAGLGISFQSFLSPGLLAIQEILNTIQGMIDSIKKGLGEITGKAGGHFQGGGAGGTGGGFNAAGGSMSEGWGWVGEEGPELRFKSGADVQVFSNSESRQMVAAASSGGGGGGGDTYITGNTFVGTGGLQELARMLYPGIQAEDQRRGNRN